MFYAINSVTGERVNALTVEQNPSYNLKEEETWYADPDEIRSCTENIDITKIRVRFRKGSIDVISINGVRYDISPCWFILNAKKLGINVIQESQEHKQAKNWFYDRLIKKNLMINYSDVSKPTKYQNSINLFELPLDILKIGIETRSTTFGNRILRIADVICPLLKRHELFGNGIVIEVQFSKQYEKTRESRELDWAIRGYSIAWVYPEDVEWITPVLMKLKKESIDVDSFANLIKRNKKEFVRDLKYCVQEECRKIDEKILESTIIISKRVMEEVEFKSKELFSLRLNELRQELQPDCTECKLKMVLKRGKVGIFWGCPNYRKGCRNTSVFIESFGGNH